MRLLVWLLLLAGCCCAIVPPAVWENTKYDRTLDLSKSYPKEKHVIEAKNIASEPQDSYYFAIPSSLRNKVALLIATLQSQGAQPAVLAAEPIIEDSDDGSVSFYKVQLPYPIAPKSTLSLQVTYAYTNSLEPVPATADLGEKQTLFYSGVKTPASAYDTTSYRLRVTGMPKADELGQVPKKFSGKVEKDSLLYGPFKSDVFEKYTSEPLLLMIEKQAPLPYVYRLEREYWISHWSDSLAVEEHYEYSNRAVKLANGFSRVDWMNGRYVMKPNPAIGAIQIPLAPQVSADDFYYTDLVGNVTTSMFHQNELILRPRFPIFGGWNYNFTLGWNHKLNQFVRQVADSHILAVPLLNGINDATYEKVEVSFLLPEGASLIGVHSPVDYDSLEQSPEYSYFDIGSGHTKVTLTYSNLVDEMKGLKVVIEYKYSLVDQLEKPLTLAGYIFLALVAVFGVTKLDFSLK